MRCQVEKRKIKELNAIIQAKEFSNLELIKRNTELSKSNKEKDGKIILLNLEIEELRKQLNSK